MGAARKKISQPKSESPMRPVESQGTSKPTRRDIASLTKFLPDGWENYFSTAKAGRYWGLANTCPICGMRPPKELKYGHRRWRWLAAHVAQHKSTLRRS